MIAVSSLEIVLILQKIFLCKAKEILNLALKKRAQNIVLIFFALNFKFIFAKTDLPVL